MEKDLWRMIDEADAQNYGNIAVQLKQDMKKSVQNTLDKAPETVRRDIGKASENLYEKMDRFAQSEEKYIVSPEVWREYEPKHEASKKISRTYRSHRRKQALNRRLCPLQIKR